MVSNLILLILLYHPGYSQSENSIHTLSNLVNEISFEMPVGYGQHDSYSYSFINARCQCSISQSVTGKREDANSITTFSFNLSELTDGMLLVSKPKDQDFNTLNEDIWKLEIGTFDILVQNSVWKSKQTKTNHFFFYVAGIEARNDIIEAIIQATKDCKGSIVATLPPEE